jgi:DNA-binding CsgD family transcriptional regulator
LVELVRRVGEAPFAPETWPSVLQAFAEVTGGWCAHLIGAAEDQSYLFSVEGGLPAGLFERWIEFGGVEAAANPRAAAIFAAPDLTILDEDDFIGRRDRARHPLYQEVYRPFDVDRGLVAKVPLPGGGSAILTVMGPDRGEPPSDEAKAVMAYLLPHLASAIQVQMRIQAQASAVALGAFDQLTLPAFACDFAGRIVAASADGERMLSSGDLLVRRQGRLRAASPSSDEALQAEIGRLRAPNPARVPSPVVLVSADRSDAAVADVLALPFGANAMAADAALLVTVATQRRRSPDVLRGLGLTAAEADVAQRLADGAEIEEIAASRKSTPQTVRSQAKSIYAKLNVRRRAELAARLRGLV